MSMKTHRLSVTAYCLLAALLMALPVQSLLALEPRPIAEVNSDALLAETQWSSTQPVKDGQHMAIVWWLPVEFWQVSLANQPDIDPDVRNLMLNMLQDYMILAVAQSDITPQAAFRFYERTEIEKSMRVVVKRQGKDDRRLVPTKSVGSQVELMLRDIGPILENAMGATGKNLQLFVFEDKIKRVDARRLDPYKTASLEVRLLSRDGTAFQTSFDTPLDSLFVPRTCSNGKPAHVSWSFCPWSGKKL